jgi:hypothetical protein
MKNYILALLLISQPFCIAAPPAPPQIPEVLKSVKAAVSRNELSLISPTPLTEEQWTAVEGLVAAGKIRSFVFSGKAGDDVALARLVKLEPESIKFFGGSFTEAGAARFAEMKSLKHLITSHAGPPTAKAATALANHPSLESFASDGFGSNGIDQIASAKNLRQLTLQHGLASDANVALLSRHPALEKVWLWPHGPYAILTDAAISSLATLPKLKDLTLDYSRFTYDGGLNHLKQIGTLEKLSLGNAIVSEADLERLKAELPNVAIKYTPMPEDKRAAFERAEVIRDRLAELIKLPEADRAAKLAELKKSDLRLFEAVSAALQRLKPSSKNEPPLNMANSGYDLGRAVRSDRHKFFDHFTPLDSAGGGDGRECRKRTLRASCPPACVRRVLPPRVRAMNSTTWRPTPRS